MNKLFLIILILFYSSLGVSQVDWKLIKDASSIKVYTRAVNTSRIKEYKAETVINTTLSALVDKITDGDKLKNWNYKVAKSSLIDQKSENVYMVYMYNDLPWPVKNRDHISELSVIKVDSETVKVKIAPSSVSVPKKDGVVRVIDFSGFWLFQKTEFGVKVTQQMHGDPGGRLPTFVVNSLLITAPYYTLRKLKEQLER